MPNYITFEGYLALNNYLTQDVRLARSTSNEYAWAWLDYLGVSPVFTHKVTKVGTKPRIVDR